MLRFASTVSGRKHLWTAAAGAATAATASAVVTVTSTSSDADGDDTGGYLFSPFDGGITPMLLQQSRCERGDDEHQLIRGGKNGITATSGAVVNFRSHPTSTTSPLQFPSTSELIVPTVQAVRRAVRLVGTATIVAADYQLTPKYDEWKGRLGGVIAATAAGGATSSKGEVGADAEEEEERRKWEEEVEVRQRALERAQEEYTAEPPSPSTRAGGDVIIEKIDNAEDVGGESTGGGGGDNQQTPYAWREKTPQEKKEAVHRAATRLSEAEEQLATIGGDSKTATHYRAAKRLLHMCRTNGGVYIKVGQHLANMDYLIPPPYIEVLSSLFDDAPVSSYDDVREVVREELGKYPEEIFDRFDETPIASASLAQVHVAYDRRTGKKLAVKVQHRGLRETSKGDLVSLVFVVRVIESLFPEFTWGWLVNEMAPQLPKELDFHNEGKNSEIAAAHLAKAGIDCVVPKVIWDRTTDRVLCMHFEEGFRSTDVDAIEKAGLRKRDVAKLISSIFNSQIFLAGFTHCDPHPANVLLRPSPDGTGKPQVVLVDHGLYKRIDDDFRLSYARLWRALMMADIQAIKASCEEMGVTQMYPLLAAMLTSRPFDEIIERSKTGSFSVNGGKTKGGTNKSADEAIIRGYAQRYMKEIFAMLDAVPRQMLLLFKLNDCLRHVDHALGSPANTLVVAGEFASRAVYEHDVAPVPRDGVDRYNGRHLVGRWTHRWSSMVGYWRVLLRIRLYEMVTWWTTRSVRS